MRSVMLYLLAVNIAAFILYGLDKHKAQKDQWRISEKTLLGIAVIGGSAGAIAGMFFFRHKTKHWYFRYGLPVMLILQIIAAIMICRRMT